MLPAPSPSVISTLHFSHPTEPKNKSSRPKAARVVLAEARSLIAEARASPPGAGPSLQHHRRGCPILASFARVGYDAAGALAVGDQHSPLLSPNRTQKQIEPPEGSSCGFS